MRIELDHLFVCTSPGAPEAEKLVQLGLHEGPPNQHPGQGTACRRFAFANAMIELIWVSDAMEAQSQSAGRTLLWQRWSSRAGNASPFGICLRPVDSQDTKAPFPSWEYRPAYLPDPLFMNIGEAGVEEPMWVYLNFMQRVQREKWFIEHPIGIRQITGLTLTTPCRSGLPWRRPWWRMELSQPAREQHLCSKLNLMATGEKSVWISGRTSLSSFNCEQTREVKCYGTRPGEMG